MVIRIKKIKNLTLTKCWQKRNCFNKIMLHFLYYYQNHLKLILYGFFRWQEYVQMDVLTKRTKNHFHCSRITERPLVDNRTKVHREGVKEFVCVRSSRNGPLPSLNCSKGMDGLTDGLRQIYIPLPFFSGGGIQKYSVLILLDQNFNRIGVVNVKCYVSNVK